MKFQHPLLFQVVGALGSGLVRHWMGTVDFRVWYADPRTDPDRAGAMRCIYAFWHETILWPASFYADRDRLFTVMSSEHRDSEYIVRVARRLGFGVVRGSTTRGGVKALRAMIRLDRGHLVVTPDGPKGPRRRVQAGAVYLAAQTGLPLVGGGMAFRDCWRARSWDRFAVPKPGTAARGISTLPIFVPADLDRAGIEHYRLQVQAAMLEATARAERWAAAGTEQPVGREEVKSDE